MRTVTAKLFITRHRYLFRLLLTAFPLCIATAASSQEFEKLTTVALQLKPIFKGGLLKTGTETLSQDSVDFNLTLASGISGGMLVRKGLTKLLALEIGINYTRRNYELQITDHDTAFTGTSEFRLTAFEIPVALLAYIRIGESMYMNASMGYCLNYFPSDILTYDDYYTHYAVYNTHFRSAIQANLGTEYRTAKSGSFYIGATYLRPFGEIYSQHIEYEANGKDVDVFNGLTGDYLTLDLRYYFHAEPPKKVRRAD